MKSVEKEHWYNNANWVVNCIIGIIAGIIICSQSFAIGANRSLTLFGSVINHNSIYFLILIYFIFLKFLFGKKYFNYLNLCLIFVYFICSGTSLLTVIQSFSLNTLLSFMLDFLFLIYLIHTFLRGTRIWKDFKLCHSPFNECTNEFMFYSIVVVGVLLLAVNLISTVVISGVILSSLDAFFSVLFGRYIFLYRGYLDSHNIDIVNDGNFDEVKSEVKDFVDDAEDKIKNILDKENIDNNIQKLENKVNDAFNISDSDKDSSLSSENKTKESNKKTKAEKTKKKGEE